MYLGLVLVLTFPVLQSFWSSGYFVTHDSAIHILRIEQFHRSFSSGQIPVRFAPDLLQGAGYPLFIINYHLPYYLAEIFLQLGFSSIDSYRILMSLAYVAYVAFSWIFFSRISKSSVSAWSGAGIVAVAPYTLANIFTRGALAEMIAVSLIPLNFLVVDIYFRQKEKLQIKIWNLLAMSWVFAALLTAHTLIAGFILPLVFLYGLIVSKKKIQSFFNLIFSFFFAICLAAFALMPAIFERSYFSFDTRILTVWRGHLLPLFSILHIPLFHEMMDSPYQVGLVITLVMSISLLGYVFFKKTRDARMLYCMVIFFCSIFLSSVFSTKIWEIFSFSGFIVFPWRLLNIAIFSAGIATAIILNLIPKYKIFLAVAIVVLAGYASRHYMRPAPFSGDFLNTQNQFDTATTEGEYDPIGMDKRIGKLTIPDVRIIEGKGQISVVKKSVNSTTFYASIQNDALLQINRLYFPGWYGSIDGKSINPNIPTSTHPGALNGLISFWVAKGEHQVLIFYSETPLRLIADAISFISLLISLLLIMLKLRLGAGLK